ncbi:mitochondrial heat shock protein Hsp10 [Friedmanniomyces endolithicus]|nr:mitochondrial heat shock protein Hsp10 [Friedmanniomyces endolithicus]
MSTATIGKRGSFDYGGRNVSGVPNCSRRSPKLWLREKLSNHSTPLLDFHSHLRTPKDPSSIQILPPPHPNTMASALRSIKSLAPLLDRVLVQRVKADVKTAGGIFLPESAQKELNQANVLAVGPGAMDKKGNRLPMGVATGDKVLIPQYGGSPIKVGEEEYSLFRDSEILAKINE